jgi:hypothetical protein
MTGLAFCLQFGSAETRGDEVRDTVVAILVMLGVAGIIYTAKPFEKNKAGASPSSSSVTQTYAARNQLSRTHRNNIEHQGDPHESTSHRSRQQAESDNESVGSEEGASSSFEQAQSLPSIYQEEPEHSGPAVSLKEETDSESNENPIVSARPQPVVYGVPVASWVKYQENQLPTKLELTQTTGMRVFFNCLEFKKDGTSPLTQKQCKEVAVSREKDRGAALIQ